MSRHHKKATESEVRVLRSKISKASETPAYKNIPKFSHVPQAVINPHSPSKRPRSATPAVYLEPETDTYMPKERIYQVREIPDHLMRAPIDPNASVKVKKVFVDTKGMTVKQKKEAMAIAQKQQQEAKRERRIQKNLKLLFSKIKQQIDEKKDDELFHPQAIQCRIGQVKLAIEQKNVVSTLAGANQNRPQPMQFANKAEFHQFVKIVASTISETEVIEIMQGQSKRSRSAMGSGLGGGGMSETSEIETSMISISNLRIDYTVLDALFDKWYLEEQTLSGVLSQKVTKQKNLDLRLKLDSWRKREKQRDRINKRATDHGGQIRNAFEKYLKNFDMERERIFEVQSKYVDMLEEMARLQRNEETVNEFLCLLPNDATTAQIQYLNLEKIIDTLQREEDKRMKVMESFISVAKQDLVMDKLYFNFNGVMDMLVNKKYKKTDFDVLRDLFDKVQENYRHDQVQNMTTGQDKSPEEIVISDETLIPLDVFDVSINQIKHVFEGKLILYKDLITSGKKEAAKMMQSLGMDPQDKKRGKMEPAVFIAFLNSRLELTHEMLFDLHYKHELIFRGLVKQFNDYKATIEVQSAYEKVTAPSISETGDYKGQLSKEMGRFNGKINEGDNSQSELTSQTALTMQQSQGGRPRTESHGGHSDVGSHEEMDGSASGVGGSGGEFRKELVKLEGAQAERRLLDDEEEKEDAFMSKQEQEEEERANMFRDPSKNWERFKPELRFGAIEGEGQLLYDNISTSYKLNLPVDYYHKELQSRLLKKDDGKQKNTKWYIKPHHCEALTMHANSIKDEVLNTHYFSHYNQDYGKVPERNECVEALNHLQERISILKDEQREMAEMKGKDADIECEKARMAMNRQGLIEYDQLMRAPGQDAKKLIIKAYEAVLTDKRRKERSYVNDVRFKEYEINRPPQDGWYALKHSGFSKELYRNRVALKPNNANSAYLERLQDPYIY